MWVGPDWAAVASHVQHAPDGIQVSMPAPPGKVIPGMPWQEDESMPKVKR